MLPCWISISLIFVVTWTFLPLLCFPWMFGVLACELWNSFTCQFIYFVIVFLPDFCSSERLDRFLHCTLYQIKSFEAMWKWFSHLLPQVLLLQGNFAINVTVCRERSCVLESDALGVNVTLLSIIYSYLKNCCSIAEPAAPFSSVTWDKVGVLTGIS